jgi:phosphohistidine phosphatase
LKVYVLRHGQAGNSLDEPGKDAARPLTPDGRREILQIATSLKSLDVGLDLIASSPLKRALETAQLVAKKLGKTKSLQQWEELKPAGDHDTLYKRLSDLKADSQILLVGHEPHLSSLIGEIISGSQNVRLVLKKGGIAKIDLDQIRPKASGDLVWLLTPKLAKMM